MEERGGGGTGPPYLGPGQHQHAHHHRPQGPADQQPAASYHYAAAAAAAAVQQQYDMSQAAAAAFYGWPFYPPPAAGSSSSRDLSAGGNGLPLVGGQDATSRLSPDSRAGGHHHTCSSADSLTVAATPVGPRLAEPVPPIRAGRKGVDSGGGDDALLVNKSSSPSHPPHLGSKDTAAKSDGDSQVANANVEEKVESRQDCEVNLPNQIVRPPESLQNSEEEKMASVAAGESSEEEDDDNEEDDNEEMAREDLVSTELGGSDDEERDDGDKLAGDYSVKEEADQVQDPAWWLSEAWERYNEFEACRYYDKTLALTDFLTEWEIRLASAVAAGCEYNDTVLAFKLLDRIQLAEEENRALLGLVAAAAARGSHHNDDMLGLVKAQLAAQFGEHNNEKDDEDEELLKDEQREEGEIAATVVKHENGGVVSIGLKMYKENESQLAAAAVVKHEKDAPVGDASTPAKIHACRQCGKSFRRADYLSDHQRSVHGAATDTATAADKDTVGAATANGSAAGADEASLVAGTMTNSSSSTGSNKPFSCPVCKKPFTSEPNLRRHMEGHHAGPGRAFRCPAAGCAKSYPERSSLMRHIRTHLRAGGKRGEGGANRGRFFGGSSSDSEDGEEGGEHRKGRKRADGTGPPFRCSKCSIEYNSQHELRKHRRVHATRIKRCAVCGERFPTAEEAEAHRTAAHPDTAHNHDSGGKSFLCTECGKSFSLRSNLKRHVKVHALQNGGLDHSMGDGGGDSADLNGRHPRPKEHKCECCAKVFVRIDLLKEHMTVHTGAKPYLCNGCGLYFSKKSNLARHSLLHLDHKPCRCDTCGKSFVDERSLMRHTKIHADIKPFPCLHCDKAYVDANSLRKHMRNHECEVCGAELVDAADVARHRALHADAEKARHAFQCETCSKTFSTNSALLKHRRYHSGERPHKCDHCEKGFVTSTALREHRVVHTGERPYACAVCEKTFGMKNNLRVHIQRVHSGNSTAAAVPSSKPMGAMAAAATLGAQHGTPFPGFPTATRVGGHHNPLLDREQHGGGVPAGMYLLP